uniref:Protein kinase domain-containing protein n=1 Tax=Trichuris muris TaxID=70415 RepID=A0A5S6R506_TRIMR
MSAKTPSENAKHLKEKSKSSTTERKLLSTALGEVTAKESPDSKVIMGSTRSSPTDYLKMGDYVYQHWQIVSRIGWFGDAQVYQAVNEETKQNAIVRACKQYIVRNTVYNEAFAMRKFNKTAHCPLYYAGALFHDCYITIAEPLGPDLQRLRCEMHSRSFTDHTVASLGVQCIRALQDLHSVGMVHRRISANCFALGMSPKQKGTLFLTDLGFARPYIHANGGHRSCRGTIKFYGHIRYASTNAHSRQDLSRRDDLWSLFYVIYEMMNGFLPWETYTEELIVHSLKTRLLLKGLCGNMPAGLANFAKHVETLEFTAEPDYTLLVESIEQIAAPCREVHPFNGFDWEKYDTNITQKYYYENFK